MKFERITLENFRQYFGRQRLVFSRDPNKNVTIIHGINGAGKTSFFLAINWCLYGDKALSNVGELMSKEAISRAHTGDTLMTLVELSFTHNVERYLVSRRITGIKQEDGTVRYEPGDEFTMMKTQLDGQTVRVNNPVGTLNAILSENVRTYFLFDGEKIDNFAKPEAHDEVRYAIYNVLKLEVLTRARRHLEDVANDYRKELKSISTGVLKELVEKEEKLRTTKERAIKRKKEIEDEIISARRKISDIDQRLRETQIARELQNQRDQIEQSIKHYQKELQGLVNNIVNIATSGYLIISKYINVQALSILDEKRARGEIPSNIRQQFIQDLIDRKLCICGRSFEIGSSEHQNLTALMSKSYPGSLEDDVLDTSATLKSFSERINGLENRLNHNMNRRAEILDQLKILDGELDDVSRQLKGSSLEEISKLEEQRRNFLADIDSYHVEQGTLEQQIDSLNEQIRETERKREKAEKEEDKIKLLTKKTSLAQQSADAIEQMYQIFADDMRKRIEAKTKEIFKLLIWKDSHFQDISLDSEYNLEVIDRYGLPARPELSAGERQVLSLSFIIAMSRVSEEEAPLVMDTPFGRLSTHHRNSITKNVPELTDQLVLFVTDEELSGQSRKNIENRIGAEYQLMFDLETSCTTIKEVE